MGEQAAVAAVDQFLGGQPAHALDEAALDLAEVDRRIQRAADVVQDVGAQHPVLAGQGVDRHFGHRGPIGEIEERAALMTLTVVVDLGRSVEAGRRQRHALDVGHTAEQVEGVEVLARMDPVFCEAHSRRIAGRRPCRHVRQPSANGHGRVVGRHAVEVGARRGRRGGGVGHLIRGRGGDLHLLERNAEHVGHYLGHLDHQALAHLGPAMVQQDRAVGIDLDQGAGLVQVAGGEGDAELHRRQGDAALDRR